VGCEKKKFIAEVGFSNDNKFLNPSPKEMYKSFNKEISGKFTSVKSRKQAYNIKLCMKDQLLTLHGLKDDQPEAGFWKAINDRALSHEARLQIPAEFRPEFSNSVPIR
jgi:hypothetical protein